MIAGLQNSGLPQDGDTTNKTRPRRALPAETEPQDIIKIDTGLVPVDGFAEGVGEVARVGHERQASGPIAGAVERHGRDPALEVGVRPGVQLFLHAVRAIEDHDDRVRAGATLRQYLVVGAGVSTGSDLLLDGAVTARVRVVGHHGLQASASRFQRTAREEGGAVTHQGGSLVMLSWVYAVDPPAPGARLELDDPDA